MPAGDPGGGGGTGGAPALTTRLQSKLADDLLDLAEQADRFLKAFERWETGVDVSPYAWDRLRERALALRQELERLGLKT